MEICWINFIEVRLFFICMYVVSIGLKTTHIIINYYL